MSDDNLFDTTANNAFDIKNEGRWRHRVGEQKRSNKSTKLLWDKEHTPRCPEREERGIVGTDSIGPG
jgi:hypothetical protein